MPAIVSIYSTSRAACRPPQNPSFHPLPSPAAEGERERGTNDSEIFMNLGAGGGVRARFFETLARYDFIGLNNLHL